MVNGRSAIHSTHTRLPSLACTPRWRNSNSILLHFARPLRSQFARSRDAICMTIITCRPTHILLLPAPISSTFFNYSYLFNANESCSRGKFKRRTNLLARDTAMTYRRIAGRGPDRRPNARPLIANYVHMQTPSASGMPARQRTGKYRAVSCAGERWTRSRGEMSVSDSGERKSPLCLCSPPDCNGIVHINFNCSEHTRRGDASNDRQRKGFCVGIRLSFVPLLNRRCRLFVGVFHFIAEQLRPPSPGPQTRPSER